MNPFVNFIVWFLGIAGKKAQAAYKRKKQKEAAQKAAKKAAAAKARAEREAAEAAAEAALEKARFEEKIRQADRQAKLAKNELALLKMRVELDENPYSDDSEK